MGRGGRPAGPLRCAPCAGGRGQGSRVRCCRTRAAAASRRMTLSGRGGAVRDAVLAAPDRRCPPGPPTPPPTAWHSGREGHWGFGSEHVVWRGTSARARFGCTCPVRRCPYGPWERGRAGPGAEDGGRGGGVEAAAVSGMRVMGLKALTHTLVGGGVPAIWGGVLLCGCPEVVCVCGGGGEIWGLRYGTPVLEQIAGQALQMWAGPRPSTGGPCTPKASPHPLHTLPPPLGPRTPGARPPPPPDHVPPSPHNRGPGRNRQEATRVRSERGRATGGPPPPPTGAPHPPRAPPERGVGAGGQALGAPPV